MTIIKEDKLCICIDDGSPEELREQLIVSLASAMRHYAMNDDKRKEDGSHMAYICDLMEQLAKVS